jgi:peroxiredoxin
MAAPDFTTLSVTGEKVRLADYRGKVVYLDFWATWCGPCVEAMPRIQKVWEQYKDEDFVVLLVSLDDKPATVEQFLKKKKLPGVLALGEGGLKGELAKLYNIESLPTNFLIGPDVKVIVNDVDAAKLRSAVRKELAKRKPAESQPVETAGRN